jgi:hypothetical protein
MLHTGLHVLQTLVYEMCSGSAVIIYRATRKHTACLNQCRAFAARAQAASDGFAIPCPLCRLLLLYLPGCWQASYPGNATGFNTEPQHCRSATAGCMQAGMLHSCCSMCNTCSSSQWQQRGWSLLSSLCLWPCPAVSQNSHLQTPPINTSVAASTWRAADCTQPIHKAVQSLRSICCLAV